jgi:2-succinyl-5-enolpyruvyl-6-hydroxy-3-cyclohexene-1-carboxylate synthase
MKIKVNRNCLWADTFVNGLSSLGVKYACISPGSRNTSLTIAFAKNKKIKSYLHIDERASAFFALGIAKAKHTPVALVCTSGTAVAEFYPAIIEAFKQRVPLIVCTADRPAELLNLGANQTIFQKDIYKNHIRFSADAGLPELSEKKLNALRMLTLKAFLTSSALDTGPVHINFPFDKPFEPDSFTDEIEEDLLVLSKTEFKNGAGSINKNNSGKNGWITEIAKEMKTSSKGIIIVGPGSYEKEFYKQCSELSDKLSYPILADASSGFRFTEFNKKNVIANYDAFLRSNEFIKKHSPELIIHFGRTVTSKYLDEYLSKCNSPRYMINEFGDWFDPSKKSIGAFKYAPEDFCGEVLTKLNKLKREQNSDSWLKDFIFADKTAELIKNGIIGNSIFASESGVINELIDLLPKDSNLMISNSMPIRDFDNFASLQTKKISLFYNRGASGIDGIISTALGIASSTNKTTILLTGDLAFYYDLSGFLAAAKYKIPLIVILINNNGGGIFKMLPVSKQKTIFDDFFMASHNLDFKPFVKGFGGNYFLVKSRSGFIKNFSQALGKKEFSVLEIKTDMTESLNIRNDYWNTVTEKLSE